MQPLDWALLPFSRYFDFSGRSPRAEYWFYTALMWLVSLLILLGQLALGKAVESVLTVVNSLLGLATLIPSRARPSQISHSGRGYRRLDSGCDLLRTIRDGNLVLGGGRAGREIPDSDGDRGRSGTQSLWPQSLWADVRILRLHILHCQPGSWR